MKLKFWLLTFLLLFARGCDFYSTSLWFFQPGGMQDETNPLTKYLGVGWEGLILSNSLIIGVIISAFYFYSFRYKSPKVDTKPRNFWEFGSAAYFGRNDRFYWLFYKMPKDWRPFVAHLGYVLVRVIIVGSLLATIHNLCQYYNVSIYDTFREIVRRPLYVIYSIIFLSAIYFFARVLKKEYQENLIQD